MVDLVAPRRFPAVGPGRGGRLWRIAGVCRWLDAECIGDDDPHHPQAGGKWESVGGDAIPR